MSLFSYWALLLLQDIRALPLVSQLYLTEDSIYYYYYYFLHVHPVIKIFFENINDQQLGFLVSVAFMPFSVRKDHFWMSCLRLET